MTPLVTLEQFAESRGVQFDPTDTKALRALEDASALFRSLARQTISLVTDDVVELRGNRGRKLWLPERPVLAVSDVTIESWDGYEQTIDAGSLRVSRRGLVKLLWGCSWGGEEGNVRLTYSHGYAKIPDRVVGAVTSMATRQLSNPGGVVSRTIGTWSETYGAPPDGTAAGVSSDELAVAKSYRPVNP